MEATIERALLELERNGQLGEDEAPLLAVFGDLGIAVETFHRKDLVRGRIDVSAATLVCGSLTSVAAGLKYAGAQLPAPFDYPESLHGLLRRRIWASDLGGVRANVGAGAAPVFVKPRSVRKRFTGRVIRDEGDLYALASVSRTTPVWCSEVVEFLAEYRVFVVGGRVVGIRPYAGDPEVAPSAEVVEACCRALGHVAGLAFDVGVLLNGSTALIEVNDGFSIARYGLDPAAYGRLLCARWVQLVS